MPTVTYCYPYKRGTGWRSQGFRTNRNQGANGPGGHTGYDQAMDAGTPLYSPCDGIVRNSSWVTDNYLENPWWLTQMGGDCLVIDATSAFVKADQLPTFILCHLQDSVAPVGAKVRKGQLVAYSGNSGTATTGSHCHIEALPPAWDVNNGVYGRVDPEQYFTEWPEDVNPAGSAAVAPQGTATPIHEEWDDMATQQQLQDAFHEELKSPRSQQLIKDAIFGELAARRTVGRLQAAVWTQVGGTRGGKLVSMWRDAVDTNTIVRQVLAAVQEIGKKSGTGDVLALDADEFLTKMGERLQNGAAGQGPTQEEGK